MLKHYRKWVRITAICVRILCLTIFPSLLLFACAKAPAEIELKGNSSPRLFIFAGDHDKQDSDFLAMIDVDPASNALGSPITSLPIGHKNSMPHHMEYVPPPYGEPIFMNAHHHELSMIVDVFTSDKIKIKNTFQPPNPYRFPHDYSRTPNGTRLVGFLRTEGASPDPSETIEPAGHGGIAEYSVTGDLIRTAYAGVDTLEKPVRPYAFALLPEIDRLVVTSAPMMETSWADVVQVYQYSDLKLLHTLPLPVGRLGNGKPIEGSQAAGFGPRILDDGSVFLNSYGCAFYHLKNIDAQTPELEMVHVLKTKPSSRPGQIRGACGIPVRVGNYWVQPAGYLNAVVVLDVSDPQSPKEVFRLRTPDEFRPHWLAKDPQANRLILGAELGGEQGFFMLRINEETGALAFDQTFPAKKSGRFFPKKTHGYISLERENWPHGETGAAWGHAALFLDAPVQSQ